MLSERRTVTRWHNLERAVRPSPADLLVIVTGVLGAVNLGLRLAGQRAHWVTFTLLAVGLPGLAIVWFGTPRHVRPGANFGESIPAEYYYGAIALALWAVFLVLELIVFVALRIRSSRAETRGSREQ